MPSFRKVSPAEIAVFDQPLIGARAQVAQEYDASLTDFAVGDYGRAELHAGERRAVVQRRLQAVARRRGRVLRFRSGPGPMTFHIAVASAPISSPALPQEPVGVSLAGTQRHQAAQHASAPHGTPPPPDGRRALRQRAAALDARELLLILQEQL